MEFIFKFIVILFIAYIWFALMAQCVYSFSKKKYGTPVKEYFAELWKTAKLLACQTFVSIWKKN